MTPEELIRINQEIDAAAMHLHALLGCHIGIVALKDNNLAIRCTCNTHPEVSGFFRAAAHHVDNVQFYGSRSNN